MFVSLRNEKLPKVNMHRLIRLRAGTVYKIWTLTYRNTKCTCTLFVIAFY